MGESVSFEAEEETLDQASEVKTPDTVGGRSLLEELQDLILSASDMQEFLNELAVLSARSLSVEDGVLCGITLLRRRRAATVAYSTAVAKELDELQYRFHEGPCLSAAEEQRAVVVEDFRTDSRWPEYSRAVAGQGMRSILSVPFTVGNGARAAMNLYSAEPGTFRTESIAFAEAYAQQASKGLELALRMARYSEEASNRSRAMESRTEIDVAVGIVMAQSRCSQAEAFEMLQRASSTRNVKLRTVAAEITQRVSGGSPTTHFDR